MNTATITATRHNGSTLLAAWECWYGASDRACQATAWAWGLYTEAFFSEAAMARYRWAGQMAAKPLSPSRRPQSLPRPR
jgi:hypothetical protein